MNSKIIFAVILCLLKAANVHAELAGNPDDPDFIHASLIVAGPGEAMYQVTGHTMIRMECAAAGLDHIFSFESEDAGSALGALFKTVNGRFIAAESKAYLPHFEEEGRQTVTFPLNLEPRVKQRLWQVLDSLTTTGEHPFNIRKESCSGHILDAINIAIRPARIAVINGNVIGKSNAIAIDSASLHEGPWRNFIIHLCVGEDNNNIDNIYNQGAPTNIEKDWSNFYIVEPGKPDKPLMLAPENRLTPPPAYLFTPMAVAISLLLLGLGALACGLTGRGRRYVVSLRRAMGGLIFVLGMFLTGMVITPSAIGGWANWNFLLLNPVPLALMIASAKTGKSYATAWRWIVAIWAVYALVFPLFTASIVPAMSVFALAAAATFYPANANNGN